MISVYTDGSFRNMSVKCGAVIFRGEKFDGSYFQFFRKNNKKYTEYELDSILLGMSVSKMKGYKDLTIYNDQLSFENDNYYCSIGRRRNDFEDLSSWFRSIKTHKIYRRGIRPNDVVHLERHNIADSISKIKPNGFKEGNILEVRKVDKRWKCIRKVA